MKKLCVLIFITFALAGCGTPDEDHNSTDQAAMQDGITLNDAETAQDKSNYFLTRPDYRKCMWPMCGGFFVHRVNRNYTRCQDGTYQHECYVAEILNQSGLSDPDWNTTLATPHLLLGKIGTLETPMGDYGSLAVSDAWTAFDDVNHYDNTFYALHYEQIICITYPCYPLLIEDKLNSNRSINLSGVRGRLAAPAIKALSQGKIIVAGWNVHTPGGKEVYVRQLYQRAESQTPFCAEYTTSDGRFYAKNFPADQQAEAEAWIRMDPEVAASGVGTGTCLDCNAKSCNPEDSQVCGLPAETDTAASYPSLCEFRKVIRKYAGTTGESKGKFVEGTCQPLCATVLIDYPEAGSSNFYAGTFLWQEQAESWLVNTFPGATETLLRDGTCGAQPNCVVAMYAPVCGNLDSAETTYDAPCLFFHAIMQDAGDKESKGFYTPGECQ